MNRRSKTIASAATAALVGLSVFCLGQSAAAVATSWRRAFVRGGDSGLEGLNTPWADRSVQWTVKGEAGTVASGDARTDKNGATTLRFPVPKVRVAAQLAVGLRPAGQPDGKTHLVQLIVLPRDPFANVRKTLGSLEIGLLPEGPLGAALKRSGLGHSDLGKELIRGQFDGKVVVLSGLLAKDINATRQYAQSLPAGTCLIVANDHSDEQSAFSLVDCLTAHKPAEQTKAIVRAGSSVWTDLPASWLGEACPPHKLGEPRNIVSLRVLAGRVGADGIVCPVAIEFDDVAGRSWLAWNPPERIGPTDPRWDLMLRNSLLWARQRLLAERRSGRQ